MFQVQQFLLCTQKLQVARHMEPGRCGRGGWLGEGWLRIVGSRDACHRRDSAGHKLWPGLSDRD